MGNTTLECWNDGAMFSLSTSFVFFNTNLVPSKEYYQDKKLIIQILNNISPELCMTIHNIKYFIDGHDINFFKTYVVPYIYYALLTVCLQKKRNTTNVLVAWIISQFF